MRLLGSLLIAAAVAAVAGPVIAQQAQTTRIETRPYYGAVVTVEHGVRVTRPIPPTQHMIINPNGSTPLVLGGPAGISLGGSRNPAQND
jgi:hypothetical protein